MKCTLMNKNTCILTAEFEPSLGVFTNIYEINNIDFAPIILKNAYNQKEDIKVILSNWFRRIKEICTLLFSRINKLKKIIEDK